MKSKKVLFLMIWIIIMCFLDACNKDKTKPSNPLEPLNCEFDSFNFIVSGEEGYYLLCDGLIGYWDGEIDHKATPLCKRPDCSHCTDECTAFISGAYKKMFYIDGALYLFSSFGRKDPVTKAEEIPLWKVAADGSSKERVLYVKELPQLYTIFQDHVYYESCTEDEKGKYISRIHSKPLNGGEEIVIWESSLQSSSAGILQGIGDRLYFRESGIDMAIDVTVPGFDFNNVETERNLYSYQPETGKLQKNPEFDGKDGKYVFFRNIHEGKLYYSYGEEREKEFWCKPLEGEEAGTFIGVQSSGVNKADSDFMYGHCIMDLERGTSSVKAYDHEGNLVQEIQLPNGANDMAWIPVTEEYILGYYTGQVNEEGKSGTAIILIERDKLAEGKAEMIRIFEN